MALKKPLFVPKEVLKATRECYTLEGEPSPIEGGFQNAVYRVSQSGVPRILRLTPARRRLPESIVAEIELLANLHQNQLYVVGVVVSKHQ
ncbi:MAG: hypothetical protein EA374_08225 [Acholeplasmatales bacterium]|nr:MAG: hypothetical protein EA374_08225 [Acholeplasmatales bacterium]